MGFIIDRTHSQWRFISYKSKESFKKYSYYTMNFFYIFLGGGIACVLRYSLSLFTFSGILSNIPLSTLFVNALSSFILAYEAARFEVFPNEKIITHFLIIGFCGGLSTFSSFTAENFHYAKTQNYLFLGLYIFISVVICLLLFHFAYKLGLKSNSL